MAKEKTDLLRGTLDLLILKALQRGPIHGFAAFILCSVVTLRATPAASDDSPAPATKMEKFTVTSKHLQSFGIALEFWENKGSQKVMEMYIKKVQSGSMAENEGLVAGTRIYEIDGVSVDSFEGTLAEGSALNRIFVNRNNGDRVTLEVQFPGKRGLKLVTLVEHRSSNRMVGPFFEH